MEVQIQRVYDDKHLAGFRVLVDRLWPRGLTKEKAAVAHWAKEIAPSDELREWFGHKAERFGEFAKRYAQELENNSETPKFIEALKSRKKIVLLYGAKDEQYNQAVVLQEYLKKKL